MSSSSGPEGGSTSPSFDVAGLEATEQALKQQYRVGEGHGPEIKVPSGHKITALLALPGLLYLGFFLVAPIVMIVLVSFWTQRTGGFDKVWTLENYDTIFGSGTYWNQIKQSFFNSLIATVACLVLALPIAYFLTFKIKTVTNQVALFIIVLAPFWTSALIRSVAWQYPLMGRNGAVNQILEGIGIIDEPLEILSFSNFSVVLAMIQLYILFMVTPLFFLLAQVDRSAIESARDLGASWARTMREIVLPQIAPGIVIGTIFVFVLTMGEYATVRIVGGNKVSSAGTYVRNLVDNVFYPNAAAGAVFLVLVMMIGVFALLRFSNLREEI